MEPADISQLKARLRAECLARRRGLSPAQTAAAGQAILSRLLGLDEHARARVVHTYVAAKDNEVDTDEFIRLSLARDKRVAVPVVWSGSRVLRHAEIHDLDQLRPGPWGLRQPPADHAHWIDDPGAIDLVIVPGLAFDGCGGRLGFGGGFYDRFLARVQAPKIGLVYACLRLQEIPVASHDVPVDIVLTESTTYRPGGGS